MTSAQALEFVEKHGAVLVSARGNLPNLVEEIAGESIKGSWWGHPKGRQIYAILSAIEDSDELVTCRLVNARLTLVHRRLWPALVKLSSRFPKDGLAKVWSEHTPSGAHRSRSVPFPKWVPPEVLQQAKRLNPERAEEALRGVLQALRSPRRGRRRQSASRTV